MQQFRFLTDLRTIEAGALEGFFDGWPEPPSVERHLAALRGSSHAIVAVDIDTHAVAGFITALSDGALAAYVPLLEVRPEWRLAGARSLPGRAHAGPAPAPLHG